MKATVEVRILLIAAAIAGLLAVARVSIHVALVGGVARGAAGLIPLIVVGGLLAVALAHGLCVALGGGCESFGSAQARPGPRRSVWWLWMGLLLLAIAVLPAAFEPDRYSLAALLVFGSLIAFPGALLDRPLFGIPAQSTVRAVARGYRSLVPAALMVSLVSTVVYLYRARSGIGSVDFFYYVCAARDMLAADVQVSDYTYVYFPGVYAFWRSVMRLVGSELADLQTGYLLVLIVNALLIAAVVARATRSVLSSALAAIWYLVLISRFEGFAGVSEPLATATLLAGCLIWMGRPLSGRRGYSLAVCLGVASGLAVYTKQQAGLLTLGMVSLLVLRPWMDQRRRHGWRQLVWLPLVAVVILLAGVRLEGRGWIPLEQGLSFAADYASEGSLLWNLYTQVRSDEAAALAAILMVLAWCVLFRSARRSLAGSSVFQLASFAVFAFLFALVQFASRPYGHYMLLGIPWLVLGCVLLVHSQMHRLAGAVSNSLLTRVLLAGVVAVLFFNTAGRENTLYVWRWNLPGDFRPHELWHEQPARRHDIAALQEVVVPHSTMYVLPQRHNSIYFLLETHTVGPMGYTFVEPDWEQFPWDECAYFILLTGDLNQYDYQFTSAERLAEMRHILDDYGFRRRVGVGLLTMELYVSATNRNPNAGGQP